LNALTRQLAEFRNILLDLAFTRELFQIFTHELVQARAVSRASRTTRSSTDKVWTISLSAAECECPSRLLSVATIRLLKEWVAVGLSEVIHGGPNDAY
jgi:hypothetical protein